MECALISYSYTQSVDCSAWWIIINIDFEIWNLSLRLECEKSCVAREKCDTNKSSSDSGWISFFGGSVVSPMVVSCTHSRECRARWIMSGEENSVDGRVECRIISPTTFLFYILCGRYPEEMRNAFATRFEYEKLCVCARWCNFSFSPSLCSI